MQHQFNSLWNMSLSTEIVGAWSLGNLIFCVATNSIYRRRLSIANWKAPGERC